MKIIVTGASGLIGSRLVPFLQSKGHSITRFVRDKARAERDDGARVVEWNPQRGELDAAELEGHDAVVHLAGEPVAEGRWTDEKKRRIRDSRVQGTSLLAAKLTECANPPHTFISASAVGFYGDRGDETLREESAAGGDFLAGVCREWEAAADAAREKGIRVVCARMGVVLSPDGGALAKLVTPFKLGVGGKLGSGEQYMSWIAIDDAVEALHHALTNAQLAGAMNVVAPNPVTNSEFTESLGRILGRPTLFTVPKFAARLAFGEMADATVLTSQRALPTRLLATNFVFKYPELEGALRYLLRS
ncbi:MAG: TIGR01777 family protein [Pyrinomonadaceae bacterium]|nr:TIGR01777 family protein [Pyrinomonadaceae bacterium]